MGEGRYTLKIFRHVRLFSGVTPHKWRKVAERLNLFLDRLLIKVLVIASPEVFMAAGEGPMPIFKFVFGHTVAAGQVLHFHLVGESRCWSGIETAPSLR